jgi:hypothetical protein
MSAATASRPADCDSARQGGFPASVAILTDSTLKEIRPKEYDMTKRNVKQSPRAMRGSSQITRKAAADSAPGASNPTAVDVQVQ